MNEGVFIVGGEGFVGSHIARVCLAACRPVTTFGPAMAVDLLSGASGLLRRVQGSADDPHALLHALRESNARTVVWAAGFNTDASGLMASGQTDPARAIAINVGAWANVLRTAAACGIRRVVACGSTVVYGAATDYAGLVGEEAAQLPRSVYGLTKSLAESTASHFARTAALAVVTLRLPLVFGPGRWYGGAAVALERMIQAARAGEEITLTLPEEPFDLIYVKDAAAAVATLLCAGRVAPVYNINGFTTSHRQIAQCLRQLCPGFAPGITYQPSTWTYPLMDDSLIRREQGWRAAFTLETALRDYLDDPQPGVSPLNASPVSPTLQSQAPR